MGNTLSQIWSSSSVNIFAYQRLCEQQDSERYRSCHNTCQESTPFLFCSQSGPVGKARLDSGLDWTRIWTGLDFFLGRVIFFGGGEGVVLFFPVCKKIPFSTFPQQAIFFHLVRGGGGEGLYVSFSLWFSLRLVALFDSRPSRFTWKLKKIAGVDVTTVEIP